MIKYIILVIVIYFIFSKFPLESIVIFSNCRKNGKDMLKSQKAKESQPSLQPTGLKLGLTQARKSFSPLCFLWLPSSQQVIQDSTMQKKSIISAYWDAMYYFIFFPRSMRFYVGQGQKAPGCYSVFKCVNRKGKREIYIYSIYIVLIGSLFIQI